MQILLADAKIMRSAAPSEPWTPPRFLEEARGLALEMAAMDPEALSHQMSVSRSVALDCWKRYQEFFAGGPMPAIMAYNGQAYKHLKAPTLSLEDLEFAQDHLWITSFLYGLLRPMDGIRPYRMEGGVRLPSFGGKAVRELWKDRLTDMLIESVRKDDGTLVHLCTEEYEHLLDWKRVCSALRVIRPMFYIRRKGALSIQAVWAKTCRGAMTRHILQNRCSTPEALLDFHYEGFTLAAGLGQEAFPHFVREE